MHNVAAIYSKAVDDGSMVLTRLPDDDTIRVLSAVPECEEPWDVKGAKENHDNARQHCVRAQVAQPMLHSVSPGSDPSLDEPDTRVSPRCGHCQDAVILYFGKGRCVDIADTLIELAEEHLRRMAAVSWAAYAKSLRQGKSGETFGCEVDGHYFDVGDQASWLDEPEGDVRLIAHATVGDSDLGSTTRRVEREAIIRRS